jgi:hypothetical protein
VGGKIAAVTEVVILGLVGGIFLGLGGLAGVVPVTQRRAMIRKFNRELHRNRDRFYASITEQLQGRLGIVYGKIDRNIWSIYTAMSIAKRSACPRG